MFVLGLTGPDDEIFDDIGERVSAMRHPGEDDMAFYERRYQERVMLHFNSVVRKGVADRLCSTNSSCPGINVGRI